MSQILVDWVNDVGLSEEVTSLEEDMRSGYLLGELLFRFNQLHTLSKFSKKGSADSKIGNFCNLYPVLRAMNVTFDARTASEIMAGKPGVSARVLYQVKMHVERLQNFTKPVSSFEVLDNGVLPLTDLPMRGPKPHFDRKSQLIFESAVRGLVESQNHAMETWSLRRFEEEAQRQQQAVEQARQQATLDFEHAREQARLDRLLQKQQGNRFLESWEQRGYEAWAGNQERAKQRKAVRRNVVRKQQHTRHTRVAASRLSHQTQVTDGIADFEARLGVMEATGHVARPPAAHPQPQPQDPENLPPEAPPPAREQHDGFAITTDRREQARGFQEQLSSMRERKTEHKALALAREKRRRRFITEREDAQVSEYHSRAAEYLQSQLMRLSAAECRMNAQLEHITRHRAMMAENRAFRQTQYKTRAETDHEEALKRDNAHLEQTRVLYAEQLNAQAMRYTFSIDARTSAARTRVEELCLDTLLRVVDLALEVVAQRNFTRPAPGLLDPPPPPPTIATANHHEADACPPTPTFEPPEAEHEAAMMAPLLPALQWQDMKRVFVAGLPLLRLDGATADDRVWGETSTLQFQIQATEAVAEAEAKAETKAETKADTKPEAEPVGSALPALLDQLDLHDYAFNVHPWHSTELEHMLLAVCGDPPPGGADPAESDAAAGAKQGEEKAEEEAASQPESEPEDKADEEGGGPAPSDNVLLTAAPCFRLGEVVVETRLVAEPLPPPPPPPDVPKFPLRVCLCGRSFSGKSEQAWRIADRYNLKVISTDASLNRAVRLAEDFKFGRMSDHAQGRIRGLDKVQLKLGQQALAMLSRGGVVADEVYAELIVLEIRRAKEENDVLAAAEQQPDAEPDERAAPLAPPPDGQEADAGSAVPGGDLVSTVPSVRTVTFDEGEDKPTEPWMGWVVEDFPETAAQAALLEKLLSGYDADRHVATRWDRASDAAEACPRPPADPHQRVPSGLDLVVYLDADRECVLRRSLGRRVDPETDRHYHLDTDRPPFDVVCKERLVEPADPANPTFHLAFHLAAHDVTRRDLQAFFAHFGTLRVVDVNHLTAEGVFAAVAAALHSLLESRVQDQSSEPRGSSGSFDASSVAAANEGGATGSDADAEAAAAPVVEGGPPDEDAANPTDPQPPPPPPQELAAKSPPAPIKKLSDQLAKVLAQIWNAAEAHFDSGARCCFRALREERQLVAAHLCDTRVRFAAFLRRPDARQTRVSAFLAHFNAVEEDMRFDDCTKAELHLRCEELRHGLWVEVEDREQVARARLLAIRTDGWLEQRIASLERDFALLMQLEVDRFTAGLHLLCDYHAAVAGFHDQHEGPLEELELPEDEAHLAAHGADGKAGGKGAGGAGKKDPKKDGGKKAAKKGVEEDAHARRSALPVDVFLKTVEAAEAQLAHDVGAGGDKAGKAGAKPGKKGKDKETAAPLDPEKEAAAELERRFFLAKAAADALAVVAPWLPEHFAVPSDESAPEAAGAGAGTGAASEAVVALHEAVWAQARLAQARLSRLHSKGAAARALLRSTVVAVYDELHQWTTDRIAEELSLCEKVVALAQDAVEQAVPVAHDWLLDGVSFTIDPRRRLLPVPNPDPVPVVTPVDDRVPNHEQLDLLRAALVDAAEAESGNRPAALDDASLSTLALRIVLLRLAAGDTDLPAAWVEQAARDQFEAVLAALDANDSGFVRASAVVDFVADPDGAAARVLGR